MGLCKYWLITLKFYIMEYHYSYDGLLFPVDEFLDPNASIKACKPQTHTHRKNHCNNLDISLLRTVRGAVGEHFRETLVAKLRGRDAAQGYEYSSNYISALDLRLLEEAVTVAVCEVRSLEGYFFLINCIPACYAGYYIACLNSVSTDVLHRCSSDFTGDT